MRFDNRSVMRCINNCPLLRIYISYVSRKPVGVYEEINLQLRMANIKLF